MASVLLPPINLAESVNFRKRVVSAMHEKAYALGTGADPGAPLLALARRWIAAEHSSAEVAPIAHTVSRNATILAAGENNLDSVEGTIQSVVNAVAVFFAGT